ncbi:Rid family hydrolase [Pelagibacterium montanilacus]|uniref:Rid family hydrolase n=1 Tax=Pelagibacterium montanilacus TaxID=2185280 RepID=UPI0013DF6255|nr:Rid family hydrolase [Pelagibacterium montanilacus]
MRARSIVETPDAPVMPIPASQAVVFGSTLYAGGQAGFDPVTRMPVSDRFDDQLRQALTNLRAVVEAGGGRLENALKVTVYVTRIEDYSSLNAVYGEFFPAEPPARKVIQCQLLPGLLAEVDAIVGLPPESGPTQ